MLWNILEKNCVNVYVIYFVESIYLYSDGHVKTIPLVIVPMLAWSGRSHITHWGRVPLCAGKLTIIGSDNGLLPGRRQAIIWTNAAVLLIGPLGTNFSEILIEIYTFWFTKMHMKISSGKWRPFCLGFNVIMTPVIRSHMTRRTGYPQHMWAIFLCVFVD